MKALSPVADVTHKQPRGGGGMDTRIKWMCGHLTRYGQFRRLGGPRAVPWRCSDCATGGADGKDR